MQETPILDGDILPPITHDPAEVQAEADGQWVAEDPRFPKKGEPYRFIAGRPVPLAIIPPTEAQAAARAVAKPPKSIGKLSKRIRDAIRLIAEHGHGITQAAEIAGCSRDGLSDAVRRESGAAYLGELVRARLATSAAKAAVRLDHLIDNARSEYVQLEAARTALVSAGYTGKQEQASVGNVSFNIDLSGR